MWLRSSSATGRGSSTCPAGAGSTGSSRRSIRRTRAASVAPTGRSVSEESALPPAEVPQDPHRFVVEVLAGVDGRGAVMDLGVQLLHPSVELVGGIGGLGELVDQSVGDVAVELVVDLVLQTGPEVHGDRADLDFADDRHRSAVEEHGHLEDRVQAAIAIRLRVGDVVLDLDDPDVVL